MKAMLIVFVLVICSGCATIKGVAHDISWTAEKLDAAIVIPDEKPQQ